MGVPDFRSILERVYREEGHTLTTKDGAGRFTEAAALALHKVDSNFGHLRKPEGRTHVIGPDGNRHAVDIVLYRATGQIVDIITDAGEPGARLSWGVGHEGEYGASDWYQPTAPDQPPPPLPPPPVDDSVRMALRHLAEQLEAQTRLLVDVGADVAKLVQRKLPTYAGIASGANPIPFGPRTVSLEVTLVPKVTP